MGAFRAGRLRRLRSTMRSNVSGMPGIAHGVLSPVLPPEIACCGNVQQTRLRIARSGLVSGILPLADATPHGPLSRRRAYLSTMRTVGAPTPNFVGQLFPQTLQCEIDELPSSDSVVPSWSQRSIRCPSVSHSTSMVIPALSSAGAGRRHSEPTSCGTAVQEAGACGEPERLALLNAARPGSARSYAASSRVSIGRTDDFRLGHGAGLLPPRRCRKSVERAGHLEESRNDLEAVGLGERVEIVAAIPVPWLVNQRV